VKRPVTAAACGPYELVAPSEGTLFECEDGSVEVRAELSYVVRFSAGAPRDILGKALSVRPGGSEGVLRFRNYVGISSLGPRRLSVCSDRLDAGAVAGMLDDVCRHLASLPFRTDTPTTAGYRRVPDPGPEVLYHSFAFLRDCLRIGQPHDLAGALLRIAANPLLTLRREMPARVPLAVIGDLDPDALASLPSEPELLEPVADGSPLASHPLAASLSGTLPGSVRRRRLGHSSDNRVNRFAVGALMTMIDWLRRFERLAEREKRVSSAANAREADGLAEDLERFLRHPALGGIAPAYDPPLQSTALRSRPGYRELLATYTELMDHASRAEPHNAQALLELRDAAAIYEFWCFFQVAEAVTDVCGPALDASRFAVETTHSQVPWGYSLRWEEASLTYNLVFAGAASTEEWPGSASYSRELRPDVALHTRTSGLHLFDAKLKLKSGQGPLADGFESEDLHKMHTYRDALGAGSAWVLYPSAAAAATRYRVPASGGAEGRSGFQGVGAVPLRPAGELAPLRDLVAELMAGR
jgi:hypothetical protein